jgi:hypothetical protein
MIPDRQISIQTDFGRYERRKIMGASFNTMTVKFCKADELKKIYNNEIENLRYEYGADPYNGTFTTCSGLKITSMVF